MIAVPLLLAELLLGYVVWDRHRFERAQLDPRVYLGAAARSGAGHAGLYSRAARAAQHSKRLCRRLQTAVRRQRRPHLTGRVQRSAATIAVVVDCHAAQWLPAFDFGAGGRDQNSSIRSRSQESPTVWSGRRNADLPHVERISACMLNQAIDVTEANRFARVISDTLWSPVL